MGPSKEKPNSGLFVYNQFMALNRQDNLNVDFFYLNQDQKRGFAKLLRYPCFFLNFIINYIFSTKKIDIIHVHFFFPNILLAIIYKAFRNWNLKIITTFHGSDIYHYKKPNIIYKLSSYCVTQFIFVSHSLHAKFYRKVPAQVISAGILETFIPKNKVIVEKKYDLIFVGHLDFNKGIDRLIKLLDNYKSSINVVVIGTASDESLVDTTGSSNLYYLGAKTSQELSCLYREAKFLINLSRNESFGLVMTEAMASGTPVIATDTDGTNAQLKNNINSFIWPNSEAWLEKNATTALSSILSTNQDDYNALSEQAIISAQSHSLSSVCKQLDAIYSNSINNKKVL